MTTTVAIPAESRVAQRLKTLIEATRLVQNLDDNQIAGDLPRELAARLSASRYRPRLERRFLRSTGAMAILPELLESDALRVASLGEAGLRATIVDAGALCQYAALRRIIDQATLAGLSSALGLDLSRHDARRAMQGISIDIAREIASPVSAQASDLAALKQAILRDGLQCWDCWVHRQKNELRTFFAALTPGLPLDGTEIAADGCKPRDCRRRAELLSARLDIALTNRAEPSRKDA